MGRVACACGPAGAGRLQRPAGPAARGSRHRRGLPVRGIVLGYYVTAVAFGLVAIFVPSRLLKIGLWLLLATAVLLLLAWLTTRTKRPLSFGSTKD